MKPVARADQAAESVYNRRARHYEPTLRVFDAFAWLGFDIQGWRREAVARLRLSPGDTVVDIGCGTGANFGLLQREVQEAGQIIGVDLSAEMLEIARSRVARRGWTNVELICQDATEYAFPDQIQAVLSTYALTLIPDCRSLMLRAAAALAPHGRLSVLDMAWPKLVPLWWRHALFFLKSYGVTAEVIQRRPWDHVQQAVNEHFSQVSLRRYWFGFFYLTAGVAADRLPGRAY